MAPLNFQYLQIGLYFPSLTKTFEINKNCSKMLNNDFFYFSIQTETFRNGENSIESFKLPKVIVNYLKN